MKLQEAYETETFITVGGHYAIKQKSYLGDDDMLILLTRAQVCSVIKDMRECLEIQQWEGHEGDNHGQV